MKILLTGVTGYVGRRLLPLLATDKNQISCLVRSLKKTGKLPEGNISLVQGDVLDPSSLMTALQGVDVAYYLIHSMASKGNFSELDRKAAQNFAEAASQQGVKRIVYLGGLGSEEDELSSHLQSRHEVGETLRQFSGDTQVIELRASIVIGSGSLSFEMIRALCERLPFMITPKWVWAESQPIGIDDLLNYLHQSLTLEVEGNPIFEIGGSEVVSYAMLMQEYCRQRGLRRWLIPVPVITPYLSSLWLGLVTPLYSKVGRKLIESACFSTIINDHSAEKYFSIEPRGVKEAIATALEHEDEVLRDRHWVDHMVPLSYLPEWGTLRIGGRMIDIKTIEVPVSQKEAFAPIRRIGGETGWYYGNWMWQIRGFMDQLVGGVGLRRGRRDPDQIREGETLDFWTVEEYEPDTRLRLAADMRVPGRAWLEFLVEGDEKHAKIRQIAIFDPIGISGLLYWYGLYPLHSFVFAGMMRGIARVAAGDKGALTYVKRSEMPVSVEELFAWHEKPHAFARLAPPWAKIEVLSRDSGIDDGCQVVLRIQSMITWTLVHSNYVKNEQFNDIQVKGPFTAWKHTHGFKEIDSQHSYLTDTISYRFLFQKLFHHWVDRRLEKLFDYRHRLLKHDLKVYQRFKGGPTMKILIAGSSGLVGSELVPFLEGAGHEVVRLVHGKDWDPEKFELDEKVFDGVDAVINLSGENIASGRWTSAKKERILNSRIKSTRLLAHTMSQLQQKPTVFINASAIGYYGESNEANENSPPGEGFLSEVCQKWEGSVKEAQDAGIRTAILRIGMVVTPKGGGLGKMLTPFKLGVGGVIGSGNQYMSWIAMDDLLATFLQILNDHSLKGPINAVSPHPVTNKEFTKTLGKVLKRPTLFTIPTLIAEWLFGEMGKEIMLRSSRILPSILQGLGFEYRFPRLEDALRFMLGKK